MAADTSLDSAIKTAQRTADRDGSALVLGYTIGAGLERVLEIAFGAVQGSMPRILALLPSCLSELRMFGQAAGAST